MHAAECTKQPPAVTGKPAAAFELRYGAAPRWHLSHCLVILGRQRQAKLLLSHHLEKIKVCIVFPRKNSMQQAAHALASQQLHTIDA